jgi:parvulin-like peptidyl-prolyl isomerase
MEKNKKGKGNTKNDKNKTNDKDKKDEKLKTCNFVKARHILCSKLSQIEEIYTKITTEHGMNPSTSEFGKLAGEFSECPSKKRGGELGYFTRGQMVGDFELAAFSTPRGQMTGIIKTKHGYHLILVEDRKASIK